ncbi:MAG: phospholipid/glycerol acyltransferase [Deltaproteobacteria bacterium]|nr:phospholipid/glycerol acyltransferase [Deltaproteobacteria bacterium]
MERGSVKTINPWVYAIIKAAARIYLAPFFELRVKGQENVPPKSSFILLPKHQRWEDIPLLGLASPVPLYYVAKSELFMNRLSNWFMSSLGGIPLDRRRPLASRNSIKAIVRLLQGRAGVVVFPEGTYYKNAMGSGHVGLIRLIRSRMDLPFIPAGIRYSGRGVRKLVEIKFGEALFWQSSTEPEAFLASAVQEIKLLSGLG